MLKASSLKRFMAALMLLAATASDASLSADVYKHSA